MSENKFNFYDIVKIVTTKNNLKGINGSLGTILGMSQNENAGEWSYGVSVDNDEGLVWSLKAEDFVATGKKRSRECYYTGEIVRVKVDPDTSEGSIPEDE